MILAMWLKLWVAQTTADTETNLGYWIGIYVGLGLLNIIAIGMETRSASASLVAIAKALLTMV